MDIFDTLAGPDLSSLDPSGGVLLVVSGLSDARMEVLLDLLHPLKVGTPKIQRDAFPRLEKPARKKSKEKRRRTR